MKLKYQVSFEHDFKPVETFKGKVTGATLRPCVGRAIQKALKERGKSFVWRSMVVCVEKEEL